eukprot:753466-Hanusia_phi.AAC.1
MASDRIPAAIGSAPASQHDRHTLTVRRPRRPMPGGPTQPHRLKQQQWKCRIMIVASMSLTLHSSLAFRKV